MESLGFREYEVAVWGIYLLGITWNCIAASCRIALLFILLDLVALMFLCLLCMCALLHGSHVSVLVLLGLCCIGSVGLPLLVGLGLLALSSLGNRSRDSPQPGLLEGAIASYFKQLLRVIWGLFMPDAPRVCSGARRIGAAANSYQCLLASHLKPSG